MPNFAANLTMMFNEVDFSTALEPPQAQASRAWNIYSHTTTNPRSSPNCWNATISPKSCTTCPPGDWAAGERGIACHPDRVGEFQEGVGKAIEYATALNCPQVNCLAGVAPDGVSAEDMDAVLVSNLSYAAEQLAAAGVRLVIEPINTIDIPGFTLNYPEQARDLIERVGSDNLFLQHDYTTCKSCKATWRATSSATWTSSATSKSPTTRAATNPAAAKSTTRTSSTT